MAARIACVELYITAKCDAGCGYCFEREFKPRGTHVPIDTLLKRGQMILELHRQQPLTRVTVIGGEPLLHPQLSEFTSAFGGELPLSIASAGLPETTVNFDRVVADVASWVVTYNVHLLDQYVRLVNLLHAARRQVVTTLHFTDYDSFRTVNHDFVRCGVSRLTGIGEDWQEAFRRYTESRTAEDYYDAVFKPFVWGTAEEKQMIVRYTAYDLRFTRKTGRDIPMPYLPQGRRFMCHLFAPTRIVSITEDGRVMPCSAIGHRHASPVIANLDRFGSLPVELAQYIEDRHAQLFALKGTTDCDLQCQRLSWNLDA